MRIRRMVPAGIALCMAFLFLSVSAMAFWKAAGETINILSMASYRTELLEQYEIPSAVYPGTSVDKVVNVKNSGETDVLIRVRFTKAFGVREADGSFTADESLDPELIQIQCNERYWKQMDGYWYYTEVLKAGEQTQEPLFEQFRISGQADNRYKGKDAEIVVTMESIQAEGNAVSLWDVTEEQIGVHYETSQIQSITSVTFIGEEAGFQFEGEDSDLFANFKYLLPGCARTQKIHVKNQSAETTELFLYADYATQDQMSEQQKTLIDKLLSEYAEIEIRCAEQLLYAGPVDGNPEGTSGTSMGERSKISLGKYQAGEDKELIVTLRLNEQMNNEFQKLIGKVCWVFTAQGDEKSVSSSTVMVPKTGDTLPLIPFCILFICSGLLVLVHFWKCGLRHRRLISGGENPG